MGSNGDSHFSTTVKWLIVMVRSRCSPNGCGRFLIAQNFMIKTSPVLLIIRWIFSYTVCSESTTRVSSKDPTMSWVKGKTRMDRYKINKQCLPNPVGNHVVKTRGSLFRYLIFIGLQTTSPVWSDILFNWDRQNNKIFSFTINVYTI